MTPPTIGRRYGALEVLGHGAPLYIGASDHSLLVNGYQQVPVSRIDEAGHLQEAGKAFPTTGPESIIIRPGLEEAERYYRAPFLPVRALVLGLSFQPVALEEATP